MSLVSCSKQLKVVVPSSQEIAHNTRNLSTHAIAYHIGKDSVPLSTVERPGFKHMIHKLNPKYDLPSKNSFSKEAIPRLYNDVSCQILSDMKEASHYSLSMDF